MVRGRGGKGGSFPVPSHLWMRVYRITHIYGCGSLRPPNGPALLRRTWWTYPAWGPSDAQEPTIHWLGLSSADLCYSEHRDRGPARPRTSELLGYRQARRGRDRSCLVCLSTPRGRSVRYSCREPCRGGANNCLPQLSRFDLLAGACCLWE